YADEDNNDRSLIVPDVKPNAVIRLNSGTYHVVSNYGTANATIGQNRTELHSTCIEHHYFMTGRIADGNPLGGSGTPIGHMH
ncbi:hypothetical protein F9K94_24305, partial [Brucella tritici]